MDWASQHVRQVAAVLDADFTLDEILRDAGRLAVRRTSVFVAVVVARPRARDRLSKARGGPVQFETVQSQGLVRVLRARLLDPKFDRYADVALRLEHLGHDSPVAILIGVCPSAQWTELFARFLIAAAPRYYRPFLRQSDLLAVFNALEGSLPKGEEIRVTRVSGLRRLLEGSSRKSYQSQVEWTDLPFRDAFARAREDATFFRRAEFTLCTRDGEKPVDTDVQGGVTNFAQFRASGRVRWLFEAGVRTAIATIEKQFALARDRGRTNDDHGQPRALAVDFTDVRITLDQLPNIAARLRAMPRASVSILHGNPYLHASIVDFSDGSSFDFVLVSNARALLLPRARATEGAVTRLCQYVYEQIGEAEFRDAEAPRWGDANA